MVAFTAARRTPTDLRCVTPMPRRPTPMIFRRRPTRPAFSRPGGAGAAFLRLRLRNASAADRGVWRADRLVCGRLPHLQPAARAGLSDTGMRLRVLNPRRFAPTGASL